MNSSKDDLPPKLITHGIPPQFPKLLHEMLNAAESKGYTQICSWQPHGLSFAIHDRKELVQQVLPLYFKHNLFASFQRQVNLYGFSRVRRSGGDHKTYYHEHFRRDAPELLELMRRVQYDAKPTMWGPRQDPDFNSMYREQRRKKPDNVEGGDIEQDQHVVTSSDDSRHTGAAVSQATSASTKHAEAPATRQSFQPHFPQDSEPEQHQRQQQTVQHTTSLTLDQALALAQLTALLTPGSTTAPRHYSPPSSFNFPQQTVSNTYSPFFSQQPGLIQDPSVHASPGDLLAALLLRSTHLNLFASHMQQQQMMQVSSDQQNLTGTSLSSSLGHFLLVHALLNNLPEQQQQQFGASVLALNQQRAFLLQSLHNTRLTSPDVSQREDEEDEEHHPGK